MNRDERNLSMLTDFYELTMMNGYLEKGMEDTVAVFDVFFRRIPDDGGFAIFAIVLPLAVIIAGVVIWVRRRHL